MPVKKKPTDPFSVIHQAQANRDAALRDEAEQRQADKDTHGAVLARALDVYEITHPEQMTRNGFVVGGFEFSVNVVGSSGRAFLIVRPALTPDEVARIAAEGLPIDSMPFQSYFEILTLRTGGWSVSPSLGYNAVAFADLIDSMASGIAAKRAEWAKQDTFAALPRYAVALGSIGNGTHMTRQINDLSQDYHLLTMVLGQTNTRSPDDTFILSVLEKNASPLK